MPRKKGTKDSDKPVPHASEVVVMARVHDFVARLLDGAETWDLIGFVRQAEKDQKSNWFLAEGVPPLGEKMIQEYKARATRVIRASGEKNRERLLADGLAKRRNLFARTVQAGDYRTALACIRDHDELLGLYPSAKKLPGDGEAPPIAFILVPVPVVQRDADRPLAFIDASPAPDRDRESGRQARPEVQHASGAVEGLAE